MNEENIRRLCAEKAMGYIKNNTTIGLGAGRNIACLIELISKELQNGLKIKAVTPSENTKMLCVKYGIEIIPTCFAEEIDAAFDGCGQVDENFYASKGGGGVFTKEKIIASMAKEYILLIDEQKLVKKLSCEDSFSLEVVKDSLGYVSRMVKEIGGIPTVRISNNKDGYLISDDGNYILDVKFENISDFKKLNDELNSIEGVIGTSIFTNEVSKVISARENEVRVISK